MGGIARLARHTQISFPSGASGKRRANIVEQLAAIREASAMREVTSRPQQPAGVESIAQRDQSIISESKRFRQIMQASR